MSTVDREILTTELVDAWEEARGRRDDAEVARQAAYEAHNRAQQAETAAQVALHQRLSRLGQDHAHRQDGRAYFAEGGRVRSLRLVDLADLT